MSVWLLILFGLAVAVLVARVLRAAGGPGPDQMAINPPETYAIHHEGKGQGMDIATRALQDLTRDIRRDAPGDTPVGAPVPGRALVTVEDLIGTAAREGGAGAPPGRQDGRDG